MTGSALPVAVHGFTWSAALLSLLNLIVGGAVVAWIKQRPRMRELDQTADAKLLDLMVTRIEKLEADLAAERMTQADVRRELEAKIDRQRELYESKLETARARHEAAEQLSRHKVANMEQCLNLFLWRVEQQPHNLPEVVAAVRKMRSEQEAVEALEKGAVAGAKITAAKPVID